MRDWISDLLLFSAGIAGGVLLATIKPYLRAAQKRRMDLALARARILANIKEKHEEEILHEAFRTTEAIRSELNKSAQMLRKTLLTVLDSVNEQQQDDRSAVQLSNAVQPNRSNS